MSAYLVAATQLRSKLINMAELFNSGDIDAFIAQHSENVAFSTPTWRSRFGEQAWGHGLSAHRSDVLNYRSTFGRLHIVDVLPVGSSVSLLTVDDSGNRTEFCLGIGANGLVTSIFAFQVGQRRNGEQIRTVAL
jgi:hypothetical protein